MGVRGSAALGSVVLLAVAQGVPANEEAQALPDLVVTATRTPEAADRTLADVTVLDRATIERRQAVTVPDLLRGLRGLSVANAGGAGKQASVFLRGTNANDVLVLVDGVRIGSATTGAVAWEFLPLAEVDRVELVRGPRSSLYGSGAVGGVVQVFTRRGGGETRASAEVGAGTRQTGSVAAGVHGGYGDGEASVHASRFATEGYNTRRPADIFGVRLDEPDADGYDNTGVSARIVQRFGPGAELALSLLHASGTTEYDAFPFDTNETAFVQQTLSASFDVSPTDLWQSRLVAGRSLDGRREYRDTGAVAETRFETESRTLSWQNDLTLGPVLATVGLDRLEQWVDSSVGYARASQGDTGLFGEIQAQANAHRLVVGGRVDDNDQFGSVSTGNLAWGYELADGWQSLLAWGSAFRAPTFNELYYPGFGNPDLEPEEAESIELGLSGRSGVTEARVSAFRTWVRNLIVFPPPAYIGENVDRAVIDGLELAFVTDVNGWDTRLSLTWLDPRNETTGKQLPRRPRQSATLDLDRALGPLQVGATLILEGPRYDDPANLIRTGGFGVLDLRAEYVLGGGWTLRGRVANLFDTDYETVAGYPEPGAGVFVSVIYSGP